MSLTVNEIYKSVDSYFKLVLKYWNGRNIKYRLNSHVTWQQLTFDMIHLAVCVLVFSLQLLFEISPTNSMTLCAAGVYYSKFVTIFQYHFQELWIAIAVLMFPVAFLEPGTVKLNWTIVFRVEWVFDVFFINSLPMKNMFAF